MVIRSEQRLTRTVEEVAELLGVSRGKAYQCVRTGELRAVRLGRRIVVPLAVIEELLAGPSADVEADGVS